MSISMRASPAGPVAASLAAVGGCNACGRGTADSRRSVCLPAVFGAILDAVLGAALIVLGAVLIAALGAVFNHVLEVRPLRPVTGLRPGFASMFASLSLSHSRRL